MAHIHEVKDAETHFIINATTREISNADELPVLVQNDHNSERFSFVIPRYVDGHDMSICNKTQVHYLNIDSSTKEQYADVYEVDDLKIDETDDTKVICTWLISRYATQYAGSLNFILRYTCETDGVIEYAWNTAIFKGITVKNGINNTELIMTEYTDILEKWKQDVLKETEQNFVNSDNHFRPEAKCFYVGSDECDLKEDRANAPSGYKRIIVILKTNLPEKMLFVSDVALIGPQEKEYNIINGVDKVEFFNHPEYSEEYGGRIVAVIDAFKTGEIYTSYSLMLTTGIKLYYMTGEVSGNGSSGSGLTKEQAEEITANTEARHTHDNADVLKEFGENAEGKPTYKGEVLGSSETSERPTETKIFLNDFSCEPNMDTSSVVSNMIYITALRDEQNDLSGKEVKKIEYSIKGEWVDIRDLISKYPTHAYAINMNRSFQYTDNQYNDTVCFAVIGYVVTGGNEFIQEISNSNQDGFRVTYYTD